MAVMLACAFCFFGCNWYCQKDDIQICDLIISLVMLVEGFVSWGFAGNKGFYSRGYRSQISTLYVRRFRPSPAFGVYTEICISVTHTHIQKSMVSGKQVVHQARSWKSLFGRSVKLFWKQTSQPYFHNLGRTTARLNCSSALLEQTMQWKNAIDLSWNRT